MKRKFKCYFLLTLGGLHMIHERDPSRTCGPIMAQGGIQAMEIMMFTIDHINQQPWWIPKVDLGKSYFICIFCLGLETL